MHACHSVEGELSPKSVPATLDQALDQSEQLRIPGNADAFERSTAVRKLAMDSRCSIHLVRERVSMWSRSGAKRVFDCACILPVTPFLIPLCLLIGLAVRLTSSGPVLFLQRRMGRHGRTFTIVKFRTLEHCDQRVHNSVTTADNQRFTPVGPFLRRWKLDELPQLWNVLKGDMSLVGARPKLPEHQIGELQCRPGITGAATLAFAREESFLARLPKHNLDQYYHQRILPAKHQLDAEYMSRATFLSDLKLLFDTVLRRWDTSIMEGLVSGAMLPESAKAAQHPFVTHVTVLAGDGKLTPEQQFTEA
jgi:lipopolysaccharide/colanic/teichoic acid biosynthesis glycosyltransferase